MSQPKQQRDSGIELLRITLMFMIIVAHLIIHGSDLKLLHANMYTPSSKDLIFTFIMPFTCIAVVPFIFISGYYGMKFKLKTLISLVIQAIFYSFLVYLFFQIFIYKGNILSFDLLTCFFPITATKWWFMSAYIGLYVISPLLNKACEHLTKLQLAGVIILMMYLQATFFPFGYSFFSADGLHLYSLVVIYLIARFCRLYKIEFPRPLFTYIFISLFIFICMNFLIQIDEQGWGWRLLANSNPLAIINGIAMFYAFKNLKIQSNLINKIAPLVLAVYLIHDEKYSGRYLYTAMRSINERIDSPIEILLIILAISAFIFIWGISIEKFRQVICAPIVDYIYNVINKFLPKILIRLNLIEKV